MSFVLQLNTCNQVLRATKKLTKASCTVSCHACFCCGPHRDTCHGWRQQYAAEMLAHCLQALEQASFALPHALVAALVNCSVQIPRPVTYLAAVFDQYGLFLADVLPKHLQTTQVAHRAGQQALFETACKGLELQQVLPLFADVVKRYNRPCMYSQTFCSGEVYIHVSAPHAPSLYVADMWRGHERHT